MIEISFTIKYTGIGIGQIKNLLCSGDTDIGQTPFLFQLILIFRCPAQREDIFLHSNQKDDWKFQSEN